MLVQLNAVGRALTGIGSRASEGFFLRSPAPSDDKVVFSTQIRLHRKPHVDISRDLSLSVHSEKRKLPQYVRKVIGDCRLNVNACAAAVNFPTLLALLLGQ